MAEKCDHERFFYLDAILDNLRNSNQIADSRANILVALSGIILSLSLTQVLSVTNTEKTAFVVIAITSFLTMFITIGVIRPRIGPSKTNTMYHRGILQFGRKAYEKEIASMMRSPALITGEYAEEIYDFSLELRERFRMIRTAADMLASGLAIGMAILIFG